MKLVTFQEPVWSTLQGEGSLVGTPTTFVRLWGCDFYCNFCDTKESWQEGSKYEEWDPVQVAQLVKSKKNRHVVVTGGNPLLQGADVELMLDELYGDYHVTLETQGSIYHPVVERINLLSISPKLHDIRLEPLRKIIWGRKVVAEDDAVQFKIVVQTEAEVMRAVEMLNILKNSASNAGYRRRNIYCFIQPEYSMGKKWVAEIHRLIDISQSFVGEYDYLRILPQIHKSAMSVL
jgi:organic radical activating enzyme